MAYLLDSDILIDHFAELPAAIQLVERLAPAEIAVSVISSMKTYEGILRSPDRPAAEAQFTAFMERHSDFAVLPDDGTHLSAPA